MAQWFTDGEARTSVVCIQHTVQSFQEYAHLHDKLSFRINVKISWIPRIASISLCDAYILIPPLNPNLPREGFQMDPIYHRSTRCLAIYARLHKHTNTISEIGAD